MKQDEISIPTKLWAALKGRLWHATDLQALEAILSDGTIRSDLPAKRYKTALSRKLCGVSLFDFNGTERDIAKQQGNWLEWLSRPQQGRLAVWLEINRDALGDSLIDPAEFRAKTDNEGFRSCKVIPYVEACHVGDVPATSIIGALVIDSCVIKRFRRLDGKDRLVERLCAFQDELPPPPPPDPLLTILNEAIDRVRKRAVAEFKKANKPLK
ncbi:MAG: hypothetical protein Q8P46_09010 [Hyphomicrobiales bacterium]|nr:hypothetical protein [Hyphomicrobiales bacterium]